MDVVHVAWTITSLFVLVLLAEPKIKATLTILPRVSARQGIVRV